MPDSRARHKSASSFISTVEPENERCGAVERESERKRERESVFRLSMCKRRLNSVESSPDVSFIFAFLRNEMFRRRRRRSWKRRRRRRTGSSVKHYIIFTALTLWRTPFRWLDAKFLLTFQIFESGIPFPYKQQQLQLVAAFRRCTVFSVLACCT